MNWYKRSQVTSDWWDDFYYHMNNTASFILQDAGIIVDAHKENVNDGRNASFMMKATYKDKKYSIRIVLEFSNKFYKDLSRTYISVTSGSLSELSIIHSSYLDVNQSQPSFIMEQIRDAILNDGEQPYSNYDPKSEYDSDEDSYQQ